MKITLLGTATSSGVPVIGCDCFTCLSDDKKNKRTRSSALINVDDSAILIDTAADFRQQVLDNKVNRIDAVLFTHAHADHVHGLDDIRFFNFKQNMCIPCFADALTIAAIERMYYYLFEDGQVGGGKPDIALKIVTEPFAVGQVKVIPIPVYHGTIPIFGYRIGDFAYVTDTNDIPITSMELLQGLKVLVLGALRKTMHPTHFSLSEALEVVRRLNPKMTYFTHVGHNLEYVETNSELPPKVKLAYDGQVIEL